MTPINAVVFDFDGLILDTEWAEHRATVEVFERYGVELDTDEYASIIGSSWNAHDELARRASVELPPREELRAMYGARIRELHAELAVLPGVEAWLAEAQTMGLRRAIASTSSEEWVTTLLDQVGLRDRFAAFSCCGLGDVMPAKPAPGCYLHACEQLGVTPANALAIEDSVNGVAAAKAAGLWCVAVPNALTRALDFSAADAQLASLADAPLSDVIAQLTA